MHFRYKAYQSNGRLEKGTLEAGDHEAAVAQLRSLGLTPLEVRQTRERRPRGKAAPAEVLFLYRQLALTLRAGLPILDALQALKGEAKSAGFRAVLADMERRISGGSDFAEALAAHPRSFPTLHVELIRAGEAVGHADEALGRCATLLEADKELRDQVTSALVYPAFVLGMGGIALITTFLLIIPRLTDLFTNLDVELPLPTQILVALGNWAEQSGLMALLLFLAAVLALVLYFASPRGRLLRDRLLLRIPLVGPAVRAAALARFARTLAETVGGGLNAEAALSLAVRSAGNAYLEARLGVAQRQVLAGQGLAAPLASSGLVPGLFVQVIRVGEETGNVPDVLRHLAAHYESEARQRVKVVVSAIEPALTLGMALAVLFFAAAVILPIFRMTRTLQQ